MLRIIKWLIIIDVIVVIFCIVQGQYQWLYNMQMGFVSSSLVLGASIFSYSRMVYRRLEDGTVVLDDDRDELDRIDDVHKLYSEDDTINKTSELKIAIKEEKQRMKQNRRTVFQTLKDSRASLSFLRLGAYLLLFLGFFYLSKNEILHIPSYLFSLALPIVVIVTLLLTKKESIHEESH